MQFQNNNNNNSQASSSSSVSSLALQVLAATASNDLHQLNQQQRQQQQQRRRASTASSSPTTQGAPAIKEQNSDNTTSGKKKQSARGREANNSSSNNSSDDDESGSRSSGSSSGGSVSKRTGLRKGKWTIEEEEYATRYIHYFSSGLLTLPEGKTLRSSLAEKLSCDPMRITKKYAGASCLGNKISKLCDRPKFSTQDVEMARVEIDRLERRFRLRLAKGVGVPLTGTGGVGGSAVGGEKKGQGQSQGQDGSKVHQAPTLQSQLSDVHSVSSQGNNAGASSAVSVPLVHHGGAQLSTTTAATAATAPSSLASTAASASNMVQATTSNTNNSNQQSLVQSYLATLASNAQLAAASHGMAPRAAAPVQSLQAAGVPAIHHHAQNQHQQQQHHQQHHVVSAATSVAPTVASSVGTTHPGVASVTNINQAMNQVASPMAAQLSGQVTGQTVVGQLAQQQHQVNAQQVHSQQQAQQQQFHAQQQAQQQQAHAQQQAQQQQAQTQQAMNQALATLNPNWSMLIQQQQQQQAANSGMTQQLQQQQQVGVASSPAGLPASSNEQLVQTLLLQITSQLQALAVLSPAALKQIQLQILAPLVSAHQQPAPAPIQAPQAAQVSVQAPQAAQVPVPQAAQAQVSLPTPAIGTADNNTAALLANFQLAAAASQLQQAAGLAASQGLQSAMTTNTTGSAGPFAQQQAQASAAPSVLNQYGVNTLGVGAGAITNPSPTPSQQSTVVSGQVSGNKRNNPAQAQAGVPNNVVAPTRPTQPRHPAPNNLEEYLKKLRQGHAEAVEKARREQAELNRREGVNGMDITDNDRESFTKVTSRSCSSITNSSDPPAAEQGPSIKKQRVETASTSNANTTGIVALLPFEHATTVSSGCTTNEGGSSSSSIENLLASDETRIDGSTSSNSSSEEEDVNQSSTTSARRSSVPLRKRKFRPEVTTESVGITRRNLDEHNVRMAEMNHQG